MFGMEHIHPRKLTWHRKITVITVIGDASSFMVVFHCHVSFRRCPGIFVGGKKGSRCWSFSHHSMPVFPVRNHINSHECQPCLLHWGVRRRKPIAIHPKPLFTDRRLNINIGKKKCHVLSELPLLNYHLRYPFVTFPGCIIYMYYIPSLKLTANAPEKMASQKAKGSSTFPTINVSSISVAMLAGWCEPPSPCCSFARHLVGKMIIHCSFAHH